MSAANARNIGAFDGLRAAQAADRAAADPAPAADSDSDSAAEEWVPYARRPEWNDVVPLEQDDGPDPVVRIAYNEKFVDVFNYFRAIYTSGEVSRRALDLTMDAAELNAANYTVWHQRRVILKALRERDDPQAPTLEDELAYIRQVIEEQPKNYQVWQHRRAVVEWMGKGDKEMRFTEIILSVDPKNYHAWQHRQWAIETYNLYTGELDYIERLLSEDIRNNSAWNQRFFVVDHEASRTNTEGQIDGDVLDREMDFVRSAIQRDPANESAWNYFRGLLDRCPPAKAALLRPSCLVFCQHLDASVSPHIVAATIDLLADDLEELSEKGDACQMQRLEVLERAIKLCDLLAEKRDVIRQEYWRFMGRDLTNRFGIKTS